RDQHAAVGHEGGRVEVARVAHEAGDGRVLLVERVEDLGRVQGVQPGRAAGDEHRAVGQQGRGVQRPARVERAAGGVERRGVVEVVERLAVGGQVRAGRAAGAVAAAVDQKIVARNQGRGVAEGLQRGPDGDVAAGRRREERGRVDAGEVVLTLAEDHRGDRDRGRRHGQAGLPDVDVRGAVVQGAGQRKRGGGRREQGRGRERGAAAARGLRRRRVGAGVDGARRDGDRPQQAGGGHAREVQLARAVRGAAEIDAAAGERDAVVAGRQGAAAL